MATIRIFSTPFCPYCITLREFFKEHNLVFEDIDVTENKAALDEMIEKSEQTVVPVVEIDGQIVVGFDREKIVQLLNIEE